MTDTTLQLGSHTPGDNTPKQEGPREGEPQSLLESPALPRETLEGSMMTVARLRKMWLQSVHAERVECHLQLVHGLQEQPPSFLEVLEGGFL